MFEEVYPRLRKYSAALNIPIQILGDLQGPKFRNGELKDDKPVELVGRGPPGSCTLIGDDGPTTAPPPTPSSS